MKLNEVLNESFNPSMERALEKIHDHLSSGKLGLVYQEVSKYLTRQYPYISAGFMVMLMKYLYEESSMDDYIRSFEVVCERLDQLHEMCGKSLHDPLLTVVESNCAFFVNTSNKLPPSFVTSLFCVDNEPRLITLEDWHHFIDNTTCTEWEDFQEEYTGASNDIQKVLNDHPNAKILSWTYDTDEVFAITIFEGK